MQFRKRLLFLLVFSAWTFCSYPYYSIVNGTIPLDMAVRANGVWLLSLERTGEVDVAHTLVISKVLGNGALAAESAKRIPLRKVRYQNAGSLAARLVGDGESFSVWGLGAFSDADAEDYSFRHHVFTILPNGEVTYYPYETDAGRAAQDGELDVLIHDDRVWLWQSAVRAQHYWQPSRWLLEIVDGKAKPLLEGVVSVDCGDEKLCRIVQEQGDVVVVSLAPFGKKPTDAAFLFGLPHRKPIVNEWGDSISTQGGHRVCKHADGMRIWFANAYLDFPGEVTQPPTGPIIYGSYVRSLTESEGNLLCGAERDDAVWFDLEGRGYALSASASTAVTLPVTLDRRNRGDEYSPLHTFAAAIQGGEMWLAVPVLEKVVHTEREDGCGEMEDIPDAVLHYRTDFHRFSLAFE
jgi:hypothetical protein